MYISSQTVKLNLRHDTSINARRGTNAEIHHFIGRHSIGSSFKGRGPLKGLSTEEERLLLPDVIGVSSKNEDAFLKETLEYWKNIEREVPPHNFNGKGGGLTLEIGWEYETKEGKLAGDAEQTKQDELWLNSIEAMLDPTKNAKEHVIDFSTRMKYGRPINIEDYITYRYCLVYAPVANDERLVTRSNKIKFYLTNDDILRRREEVKVQSQMAALALWLKLSENTKKLDNVLLVMKEEISTLESLSLEKLHTDTEGAKISTAKKLAESYPMQFVNYAKDENLHIRSFIVRCLNAGHLTRIAATSTIMYDDTMIGRNMNDAILFLKDAENNKIKVELSSKLKTNI
jgi:hypothetical protein